MNNLIKSNSISVFNFKSTPVRTQLVDDNIWFCLIDVCDSLNLKRNSSVISRLEEKGCRKTATLTEGGIQELNYINEPNLYRLIFRSNKPAAVQFGNWVYEEVLPSIRKTGSYGTPAIDMKAIGSIVKKCTATAIKEVFADIHKTDPVRLNLPKGKEVDESLLKLSEAAYEYGRAQYQNGRIDGILTGMFSSDFQNLRKPKTKQ